LHGAGDEQTDADARADRAESHCQTDSQVARRDWVHDASFGADAAGRRCLAADRRIRRYGRAGALVILPALPAPTAQWCAATSACAVSACSGAWASPWPAVAITRKTRVSIAKTKAWMKPTKTSRPRNGSVRPNGTRNESTTRSTSPAKMLPKRRKLNEMN